MVLRAGYSSLTQTWECQPGAMITSQPPGCVYLTRVAAVSAWSVVNRIAGKFISQNCAAYSAHNRSSDTDKEWSSIFSTVILDSLSKYSSNQCIIFRTSSSMRSQNILSEPNPPTLLLREGGKGHDCGCHRVLLDLFCQIVVAHLMQV